jgi:hypothetical protein
MNADGTVVWQGRYPIHKGAAQAVAGEPGTVLLIASTGLCWVIDAQNGQIIKKTKVVMGPSGEKNYATATAASYVGYTNFPSSAARFGIDEKAIPVASKPPYDTGNDFLRCCHLSAFDNPTSLWWVMILNGKILFNYIGPKMRGKAKYDVDNLPCAGSADMEPRHVPSLFQIPGNRKEVGIALKDDGQVYVQPLTTTGFRTRLKIGPGNFPTAVTEGDATRVAYFSGGSMFEATVTH